MKAYNVFLLLLIITWGFCKPFKVIEQTSQDWAGGREESGFGTMYRFKMVAKKGSDRLKIDRLWVGEYYYEISPYKEPGFFGNNDFTRKDTIRILATKYQGSDLTKDRNIHKNSKKYIAPPIDYQGDAIIGYMLKNKRRYKKIESFTRLKKLNYQ